MNDDSIEIGGGTIERSSLVRVIERERSILMFFGTLKRKNVEKRVVIWIKAGEWSYSCGKEWSLLSEGTQGNWHLFDLATFNFDDPCLDDDFRGGTYLLRELAHDILIWADAHEREDDLYELVDFFNPLLDVSLGE